MPWAGPETDCDTIYYMHCVCVSAWILNIEARDTERVLSASFVYIYFKNDPTTSLNIWVECQFLS